MIGDTASLRPGGLGVALRKGGRLKGRDDAPAEAARVRERVVHDIHPAALPASRTDSTELTAVFNALRGLGDRASAGTIERSSCKLRRFPCDCALALAMPPPSATLPKLDHTTALGWNDA